jgi:hypothetical protein
MGFSPDAHMLLQWTYLNLGKGSIPRILNHSDWFVSQSQGNESIEVVYLYPHAFNGFADEDWDKLGQAIGNLHALKRLSISTLADKVVPNPDWERLARILSHVRQEVSVVLNDDSDLWTVRELQALARAIRGHPTITAFNTRHNVPYGSMDSLYSALATLPALESVRLSDRGLHTRPEAEFAYTNPESLTDLLRAPTLRSVSFLRFLFPRALCQATANALMEGAAITKLEFEKCSFPDGESDAIMANGFSRNTSVSHISVVSPPDQALNGALATALPSNSTLQELWFDVPLSHDVPGAHVDCPPIFLALGKNTGLKTLIVNRIGSMDESLCTAMQNGLGMNDTLESLDLKNVLLTDDNSDLWCRALSFLRTNKTLKSFVVTLEEDATESRVFAFRIDIAAMLQDNTSLESLCIQTWNTDIKIKAKEYFVLVTALQHNRTLKTLNLNYNTSLALTHDEDKQMAVLLKKNYALESLPHIDLKNEAGDVGAILQLNEAGRRYLIEDGSSVSKGVEVLSAVSEEINCVFLHLLENPRLCDRSAVEKVSTAESNGRSTTPTASIGGAKREQASVHKGKSSRRRLA